MSKLYVYYEPVRGMDIEDQLACVALCGKSWMAHGWDFEVMGRSLAERHPMYPGFMDTISKFPTINSPEYERACFLRWLALDVVGGGWMSDYDVLNRGFKAPENPKESTTYCHVNGHSPPVFVTALDARFMVELFLSWDGRIAWNYNGKPHLSDMHIIFMRNWMHFKLEHKTGLFQQEQDDPDWRTRPLLHVSNRVIGRTDRKAEALREVLVWMENNPL